MAPDKPDVLLILADDVGWFDVSAYQRGIMGTLGFRTILPASRGRGEAQRSA